MNTCVCRKVWLIAFALIVLSGCKSRTVPKTPDIVNKRVSPTATQELAATAYVAGAASNAVSVVSTPDYKSIFITSNQFLEMILRVDSSAFRQTRKHVIPEVFTNANALRLDDLFERMVQGYAKNGHNETGESFGTASCALRYRALLPYLRDSILADAMSNNWIRDTMCINLILSIPHADTLRIWDDVNRKLPANSPLRVGTTPQWTSSTPRFMRNDCLEIYLDIANHPDRHDWGPWWDAVEKLVYFTNDTAVAGLQFSLKVMKDPGKYWPGMKPSLYIWSVEDKIKTQQEFMQGKRGPINMDRDKPFDE